jgi:hypothetical protein
MCWLMLLYCMRPFVVPKENIFFLLLRVNSGDRNIEKNGDLNARKKERKELLDSTGRDIFMDTFVLIKTPRERKRGS